MIAISESEFAGRLTEHAHELWESFLVPGMIILDATAGNGYDTQFLAEKIGAEGKLFAIDIQKKAISSAQARVNSLNVPLPKIIWINANHNEIASLFPKTHPFDFICYNLGYLPQSDHEIITSSEDTLVSIQQSLERLRPDGHISVMAYRGHEGGLDEYQKIDAFFRQLPNGHLTIIKTGTKTNPGPVLFLYSPTNGPRNNQDQKD